MMNELVKRFVTFGRAIHLFYKSIFVRVLCSYLIIWLHILKYVIVQVTINTAYFLLHLTEFS